MKKHLWLDSLTRSRHQLTMAFGLDDLRFQATYWYGDVDLLALERRYGQPFLQKIYFHIMAFEVMKLVSLAPATLDLGPFAHFHTPAFEQLWQQIVNQVWAQWRYENGLPHYRGPRFTTASTAAIAPVAIQPGAVEYLSFCGGGKDSYVAMKLLEGADIPYASFAYSHSSYGQAQRQHTLIDGLLNHGQPRARHQLWAYDTLTDTPLQALYPEYQTQGMTAAETPASIFAALPLVLQYGYHYLVLAHERSANVGNLVWDLTGEEVNHQWGKSFAAEQLLNAYLQQELISNCTYFSLLQPIHDTVIFSLLSQHPAGVPATHSCNLQKPWCCRCPKCAYVWLNYMAYLDVDLVNEIFPVNLFDLPENQLWFQQMLGLAEHTPFECIGQIEEARLAFELCRRKGLIGQAMTMYGAAFARLDVQPILERFFTVNRTQHQIPSAFAGSILAAMERAAMAMRQQILAGTAQPITSPMALPPDRAKNKQQEECSSNYPWN
ncbi:MAG: hypothetical protein R3E79_47595 [Caldilineaceae bacterium]